MESLIKKRLKKGKKRCMFEWEADLVPLTSSTFYYSAVSFLPKSENIPFWVILSNPSRIEMSGLIKSVWINRFHSKIFEEDLILRLNVVISNISGSRWAIYCLFNGPTSVLIQLVSSVSCSVMSSSMWPNGK